jgi:ADP-ribose pyrophosphatase YjhB (NUDIX family)
MDFSWIRFCPRCGGSLEDRFLESESRNRHVCQACGFIYYLNPKVVACAIPQGNGGIYLLKRNIEPGLGLWTFPGGYVDLGEPVSDAAIRETIEETLLQVRIDSLLNVYSYSGAAVVLVVFLATVTGGQAAPTPESQEVRLFTLKEIPWKDLAFPSTHDALSDYCRLRGQEE